MKVCVITDNEFIFTNFKRIIDCKKIMDDIDFFYSSFNALFAERFSDYTDFKPILLKEKNDEFYQQYDVYFSLHCKQLFPDELVKNFRCINVHPGLNPYNRGWYPQVFSIINKMPIGVTVHEMDTELDHGSIIFQEKVDICEYETSFDVYRKIQYKEIDILNRYIEILISGDYSTKQPLSEGSINTRTDFLNLCKIDLNRVGTFREFLDILRATTFCEYDNAFFYDSLGNKIYVSVNLKKSE